MKVVDRRWWARQAADPDAAAGDTAPPAGAVPPSESQRPAPVEQIEELERRLAEKDALLQRTLTEHRRAVDEFEASRARLRREVGKDVERARRGVLVDLLEVLDNLDLAIDAIGRQGSQDRLLEGVHLVRAQFLTKLEGWEVRPVLPAGLPFDPTAHEAVSVVEVDADDEDGLVMAVVRAGYAIGNEVLRPARVAVGRKP